MTNDVILAALPLAQTFSSGKFKLHTPMKISNFHVETQTKLVPETQKILTSTHSSWHEIEVKLSRGEELSKKI